LISHRHEKIFHLTHTTTLEDMSI